MKKIFIAFSIFPFFVQSLLAQQYVLLGETTKGGLYNHGTIFQFNPVTGKDTILYSFNGNDGDSPEVSLYLTPNKILYGGCEFGGTDSAGVLFKYNLITGDENTILNFTNSNGASPAVGLVYDSGNFYGTTGYGGVYGGGVIFSYNILLNQYNVVFNFNDTVGENTYGNLFILNDTSFYGMTEEYGQYGVGTIYRFNPKTQKVVALYSFNWNTDGGASQGTFIKYYNGLLYAMTSNLGPGGGGVLFSFDPVTNTETNLVDFSDSLGLYPFQDLLLATDSLLYGMTALGGSNNDGVLFSYNVTTNKYNIVISFDSLNGKSPDGGDLIEDTVNKILYGMTRYGGSYDDGVIFSYNLITKKYSVLLNFDGANGANPQGTLLLVDSATALGMPQLSKVQTEINVYPNPGTGIFTFSCHSESSEEPQLILEVYNVLGEKVYNETLRSARLNESFGQAQSDNTIDLSNQPNGVYLYRVISENRDLIGEGKLVKEQ